MRRMILMLVGLAFAIDVVADTECVGDVTWRYTCDGEYARLSGDSYQGITTVSKYTNGEITIPTFLNRCLVVEVDPEAFFGCQRLTAINVEPNNMYLTSVDGILYDWDMTTLIRCPQKKTEVVVPVGVRTIANGAFAGCTELSSVELPNTLDHIEMNAFLGCTKLSRIVIPSSVDVMDSGCLSGCLNLKDVYFEGDAPDVRAFYSGYSQVQDEYGRTLYYVQRDVRNLEDGTLQTYIDERYVESGYCRGYSEIGPSGEDLYVEERTLGSGVTKRSYSYNYDVNLNYDITQGSDASYVTVMSNCHFVAVYDICDGWGAENFSRTSPLLTTHVKRGTKGWNWGDPSVDPTHWCGRRIEVQIGDSSPATEQDEIESSGRLITLVTTNVIVHYITQSIQSTAAAPVTQGVGLVNVMTEVKGGNVAIPESWATNYSSFVSTFGSDFTKALMKQTNKRDGTGNPMYVWQDYVAGTDPTKDDDVFKASVTMVEGNPVVSYTPELTESEKALRKYTTWGKIRLQDENWVEVPEGHEGDYNFFKVTVEMK